MKISNSLSLLLSWIVVSQSLPPHRPPYNCKKDFAPIQTLPSASEIERNLSVKETYQIGLAESSREAAFFAYLFSKTGLENCHQQTLKQIKQSIAALEDKGYSDEQLCYPVFLWLSEIGIGEYYHTNNDNKAALQKAKKIAHSPCITGREENLKERVADIIKDMPVYKRMHRNLQAESLYVYIKSNLRGVSESLLDINCLVRSEHALGIREITTCSSLDKSQKNEIAKYLNDLPEAAQLTDESILKLIKDASIKTIINEIKNHNAYERLSSDKREKSINNQLDTIAKNEEWNAAVSNSFATSQFLGGWVLYVSILLFAAYDLYYRRALSTSLFRNLASNLYPSTGERITTNSSCSRCISNALVRLSEIYNSDSLSSNIPSREEKEEEESLLHNN